MKHFKLILILSCMPFLNGCGSHLDASRECLQSTATVEDKLECGKNMDPGRCWDWVKESKCVKWQWTLHRWSYNEGKYIDTPCSKVRDGDGLETCVRYGWNPQE